MNGVRGGWHHPGVQMLVVLVLVIAAATIATTVSTSRARPAAVTPEVVPVTETTVACPGLRSRKGFTESAVAAATPPTVSGVDREASGSGIVRTLSPRVAREKTLISLAEPGDRGAYVGRNGERDSVTGSASGSLAPGFSVTQTERTVDGAGRGLASTQCQPTGTDFWFVGAASGVGQRAVLVLTNPESATATVDVTLHGRDGVIDAPGARGVQVGPRTSVDLRIDEVAPGEKVLAVHAQVRVGRLSAAITETDADGFEPGGTDWIPAASPPTTNLVVPGVPAVSRSREAKVRLDVVAEGEAAVVTISVVTPDGSFAPEGVDVLDVPEQGVASVDLTEVLGGDPAAIVLSSDVPVTAGARVLLKNPDIFGDVLFLAAADSLGAPAVVPDNRTTKDLQTRLILSAPDGGATAVVKGFAAGREWTAGRVSLASGATKVMTIPPKRIKGKKVDSFGLVITPGGSGSLYGVRMLDEEGPRGPLVTSFPLTTARLLAEVPETFPDISVGSND
ncbi:MAG TPA: DUF5719 family protein [Actinomycetes bacterium]|nr:DUF5719 family protein [Actinomycetes bacterium]